MCQADFDVIHGIGFHRFLVKIFLVIFIEVNEIGIVIAPLPQRAVPGEMTLLSTLETSSIGISARWSLCGCCPASSRSSSVPSPVWCVGVVYIHGNRLVIHPSRGIGCHDQPKFFISCGPSVSTSLVSYPRVAPTIPGISAPQNSITTLGVQPTHASLTPAPVSSIKEQPNLAIAAPQPSRLIIPPDVTTIRHPIRNPSPLQVDQYMSSPCCQFLTKLSSLEETMTQLCPSHSSPCQITSPIIIRDGKLPSLNTPFDGLPETPTV